MIGHVVVFKLKEPTEESLVEVMKALEPLGDGRIPSVNSLALRPNAVPSPVAWEVGLFASMADVDGLRAYLQHPEHLAAVQRIQPYIEQAAIIDYEE